MVREQVDRSSVGQHVRGVLREAQPATNFGVPPVTYPAAGVGRCGGTIGRVRLSPLGLGKVVLPVEEVLPGKRIPREDRPGQRRLEKAAPTQQRVEYDG